MPYQNWEVVQDIVERLRICKVRDVVDNLHVLRDLITQRQIDENSVERIQANIYTCEKETRLPANEHFVIDGDGHWSFNLDKLVMSVRSIHQTVEGSKDFRYSKLRELEEQALGHIHKILNLLHNLDDVFTRSTFEKKYSLIWVDDESEKIGKVKGARKSSTKFRKSLKSCNNGEDFRKIIQQEIDECMQSENK